MDFFSLRAECAEDVRRFLIQCNDAKIDVHLHKYSYGTHSENPSHVPPEREAELQTTASLESLRDVLRQMTDTQVMLQTLRKCRSKDNSFKRDFDVC